MLVVVDELFSGIEINGCYQFRVTRNSDLYVDEEEVDDLVHRGLMVGQMLAIGALGGLVLDRIADANGDPKAAKKKRKPRR